MSVYYSTDSIKLIALLRCFLFHQRLQMEAAYQYARHWIMGPHVVAAQYPHMFFQSPQTGKALS